MRPLDDSNERWPETLEKNLGLPVANSRVLAKHQLVRHASRSTVARIDDADRTLRFEQRITPGNNGAQRFRRIAFAVGGWNQSPAEFGHVVERCVEIPLEMREPQLADAVPDPFSSTAQ